MRTILVSILFYILLTGYKTIRPASNDVVYIHLLVPLCDNDNQGIVPVNKQLGDGTNLKTNLYWGAGYGIKSYFKLKVKWHLDTSILNPEKGILERVVFSKTMGAKKVFIVADAYRGDQMNNCMRNYFNFLAGSNKDSLKIGKKFIPYKSNAHLLIFNGHNGLMDTTLNAVNSIDQVQRKAAVIACASKFYFPDYFKYTKTQAVITTTGLMAPEAYVAEALITSFVEGKTGPEIRKACGNAYHAKHPKSSLKACVGLFHAGE